VSEENKAKARQLFEGIGAGNLGVIDALVEENFVEHEALPPELPPGKEGVKAMFGMLRGAFPDLQVAIDQIVAEGDLVSAFVVFKGTHKGDFMGIPATGKPVAFNVSDLLRFKNGKISEHWGVMDMAGLMQQLGVGGAP
jgi:steroid delta-isomerase-like uncharacterized protein